jgi:hypothetical protein
MPYSIRNGVKTYYEVSGEDYPFVLMHANPFDRRALQNRDFTSRLLR